METQEVGLLLVTWGGGGVAREERERRKEVRHHSAPCLADVEAATCHSHSVVR